MIREYALVIMNEQDQIIDRYNLDLVTAPTGNGFQLELSTIATDIEDVITKVVQKKPTITMTVHLIKNGYSQSNILTNWIQKYSTADTNMFLEYNDTTTIKYCSGKVTSLTKTEKDEYKDLAQDLTFTMSSPFFTKKENIITIQVSGVGKKYAFRYPYQYGKNIVKYNEIENQYIFDVPVIVTIDGAITNPTIDLLDENNNTYARVRFLNTIILKNEKLIINSIKKKIYKIDINNNRIDYTPKIDPQHDSFIMAKHGISKISINTDDSGEGFKLTGSWRQYTL